MGTSAALELRRGKYYKICSTRSTFAYFRRTFRFNGRFNLCYVYEHLSFKQANDT